MKWMLPAVVAAVLALTLAAYEHETTPAAAPVASVVAAPPPATTSPPPAPPPRPAVQAAAKPPSLAAAVDELVRKNTPKALYAAYKLAQPCVFKRSECGDLSPGQVASRREWLASAAEAGVHGAVTDWFYELYGQDHEEGRAVSDADYARLMHYVDVGAEHGDKHSLVLKHGQALRAGDDVAALTYAVAAGEGDGKMAAQLRRGLTAEQIAKAEKNGREMAERAGRSS